MVLMQQTDKIYYFTRIMFEIKKKFFIFLFSILNSTTAVAKKSRL